MSSYQPNIPTGFVNLDTDYQNIQGNFQQLDTSFGVDHTPFSGAVNNGYHQIIHFQSNATPAAIANIGQLFSAVVNDGLDTDTVLYFLTGKGKLLELTSNVQPSRANNGYTFLPGGLILQWMLVPNPIVSTNYNYPKPFPNAVFNISLTPIVNDNSTIRLYVSTGTVNTTSFQIESTSSSHFTGMYVTAIGY